MRVPGVGPRRRWEPVSGSGAGSGGCSLRIFVREARNSLGFRPSRARNVVRSGALTTPYLPYPGRSERNLERLYLPYLSGGELRDSEAPHVAS